MKEADKPPEPRLRKRDRMLLRLLAEGLTTAQMAGLLFMSSGAVTRARQQLQQRLGVTNGTAAVALALRHRWID